MKKITSMFAFIVFMFSALSANATIKGTVDALFIEDGKWTLTGWACQNGTALHPTVKLWSGFLYSTYLGSTTANLTSEPAVAAACSNTQTDLRWTFTISDSVLNTIKNWGIKVEGNVGLDVAALTNSTSFKVPSNYLDDPVSDMESATKLMFFGAHPDDELNITPIFADLCNRSTISCKFAVATIDYLTPTNRDTEMINSAAVFDADLEQENFTSTFPVLSVAATLAQWATDSGLPEASDWAKDLIDNYNPDFIVTFDPRNGVSCHQEHRAVAEMVIDAADELNFPDSDLILFSHFPRLNLAAGTNPHPEIGFWRDDAFDTSRHWSYSGDSIVTGSTTGWDKVIEVMGKHPSQFDNILIDRAKPLHYTNLGHTSFQWVGNDVSGRLVTLHRYSDYVASETPYTAAAQGCPN